MTDKNNKNLISFNDIKVGDKLRIITALPKGTVQTVEGLATYRNSYSWSSADTSILVEQTIDHGNTRTIELLDRPSMPVTVGTVIEAYLKVGGSRRPPVHMVRVQQSNPEDQLLWLELSGAGDTFRTEDEILSWKEMKLVVADA